MCHRTRPRRARASDAASGRHARARASAPLPRPRPAPGRKGTRAGRWLETSPAEPATFGRGPLRLRRPPVPEHAPGAIRAGSRPRRTRGGGRVRARATRASGGTTCGRSPAWSVGSGPILPLEAVPNFSEGRDRLTIAAIGEALAQYARVLDTHSDADHNRSVYTIVGSEQELTAALIGAIETARERIDLGRQEGAHPRTGAADVVPIVPIRDDDAER